jgi:hypothetical protein
MRGRPRLTEEAAAAEAARIINVATALRYRPATLQGMGFISEGAAAAFVFKRRRGQTGKFVGNAVRHLFPAENLVQVAVSLVLDHEMTRNGAAKMTGVDPTNLARALVDGAARRDTERERVAALKTQVVDAG